MTFFKCIADGLATVWQWCLDRMALLRLSRFAALGAVVYAMLIAVPQQGVETALDFISHPFTYTLLTLVFAFNVWVSARLMVTYRYLPIDRRTIDAEALKKDVARFGTSPHEWVQPSAALINKRDEVSALNDRLRDPQSVDKLKRSMLRIPRFLGTLVVVAAAVSLCRAGFMYDVPRLLWGAFGMSIVAALFYVFVAYRRWLVQVLVMALLRPDWLRQADDSSAKLGAKRLRRLFRRPFEGDRLPTPGKVRKGLAEVIRVDSENDIQERWRWRAWGDINLNTRYWTLAFAVIATAVFGWAMLDPISFGQKVGPAAAYALTISFWMMLGTVVVYLLDQRRIPVLTLAITWALALSLWFDNHGVQLLSVKPAARPTLQTATETWDRSRRPIVVATAGGGIRAAYWTAAVLSELHEKTKGAIYRDLFAVSAVSGGGLGAAGYLAAASAKCAWHESGSAVPKFVEGAATGYLETDFLSPTFAAMFGRDLTYSLLPLPFIPDRAQALEGAWNEAWRRSMGGLCPAAVGLFEQPFLGASGQGNDRPFPLFLVNGTLVDSGRRIITAPVQITNDSFREAQDFYDYVDQREVSLHTAVHNGARFTYVSPAGTLEREDGSDTGQIVDGGYFENYGAETVIDLLRTLYRSKLVHLSESAGGEAPGDTQPEAKPNSRKMPAPIVIQISSDPKIVEDLEKTPTLGIWDHTSQVRAPIMTLFSTRGARGLAATAQLRTLTKVLDGDFFHLRLCQLDGRPAPPLGWALWQADVETIKLHLAEICQKPMGHANAKALDEIVGMVGTQAANE